MNPEKFKVEASDSAVASEITQKPFEDLLSSFLAKTIRTNDWSFYVNDESIPAEILTGNKIMLPAIVWQAEKTHRLLTGQSLGVKFRSDPDALVGATAVLEHQPGTSKTLYFLYSLETLVQALENFTLDNNHISRDEVRENILMGKKLPPKGTSCSLDHLFQVFFQSHELKQLPWTSDSNPRAPSVNLV